MNLTPILEFLRDNGGWGAWILTICWIVWMVVTDRLVTPGRHKDLKERLAAEEKDKEFWRDAATLSTEIGALLSKAKVRVPGRRESDDGSTEG